MHATVEREKPGQHAKGAGEPCACGGSGGPCSCAAPATATKSAAAGGAPLAPDVARDMSSRFGHDFGRVRVHDDTQAAESAAREGALAFTVGQNVYFGAGQYRPDDRAGRRLLAHELVHTLQQRESAPRDDRGGWRGSSTAGGGYRFTRDADEPAREAALEREAEQLSTVAEREPAGGPAATQAAPVQTLRATRESIARTTLPTPVPLCGKTLTDIEILPPRARPLEPCLPPTTLVTRINIVGRDATSPSGRSQVFNLHLGYYTDPTTGQYCAIADDSKTCVCGRCVFLGCFPTLREIADALIEFVKNVLLVLGVILLAWIIAEIIAAILGLILAPAALLASADTAPEDGAAESGPDTGTGTAPAAAETAPTATA